MPTVTVNIDASSKVPYTGATGDVDLGTHALNAKSFHVKGTAGNGYLGLKHQSSDITAAASESSLGANSLGNPVWKNDGNALQSILLANAAITGATKTKITYDANGLVTSGANATTADIADSLNARYVTDAQLTVIGNTSGTNTGDNATNSQYSGLAASKQDTLISGTNIKTINGSSILSSGDLTLLTSLSGAVLTDQTTPQTIGLTGSRLSKLWATDITVTNEIVGATTLNALLAGRAGGQTLIGGTGVTDVLNLQGTSGNGTLTADAIVFKTGNNGATSALRITNNGNIYGSFSANPLYSASDGNIATNQITTISNNLWLSLIGQTNVATGNAQIYLGGRGVNDMSNTSGSRASVRICQGFLPTSGTAIHNYIDFTGTIVNQTGGANGITRGLFINPTLTAAADWRSIETYASTGKLLRAGYDTSNYFDVTVGSTGGVTFDAVGSGAKFTFSDNLIAPKYFVSALNTAPSSASDTGTTGEIRWGSDYVYLCTATDTWKRAALATW